MSGCNVIGNGYGKSRMKTVQPYPITFSFQEFGHQPVVHVPWVADSISKILEYSFSQNNLGMTAIGYPTRGVCKLPAIKCAQLGSTTLRHIRFLNFLVMSDCIFILDWNLRFGMVSAFHFGGYWKFRRLYFPGCCRVLSHSMMVGWCVAFA